MPDIVVHAAFGRQALEQTDLCVREDVYRFGLLGPDPYLFYRFYVPPFRHAANRYSSVMHRERTGDFLWALARRARDDADVFSWLCGFLCHYALDAGTHPYIIACAERCAPRSPHAMHMAIEHALDRQLGGEVRIPPFLPDSMRPAVSEAIGEVYGWKDAWGKLKDGHRDMAPFYHLALDKRGTLNKLFGWTQGPAAMFSYKSDICDRLNLSGFWPLYDCALRAAVNYLTAARDFARGASDEGTFRRIIGNRSYIEG